MKFSILCLLAIFLVAQSENNYDVPNFCLSNAKPPGVENISPIVIANSLCGAYGSFDLNLPHDDSSSFTPFFNETLGAYQVDYTDGTLTINGTTYTSNSIAFRYKAENYVVTPNGQPDGEIQILMQGPAQENVVFSLFVYQTGNNIAFQNAKKNSNVNIDLTSTSWTISLQAIGEQIINGPSQDRQLNVFTYVGTQTYTPCDLAIYYLFGGSFYCENLTEIANAMISQNVTVNSKTGANSKATTNSVSNPIVIERLCFHGFFENDLGENYGLWFGVVIILIFFILTLCVSDRPNKDPEYQESCKTIHPLYSYWFVSNEIHTRKCRSALILMTVTIHALFTSTWYRRTYPDVKGSDIIVFAVYSMLISWGYIYILGNILRGYYTAKYHFCKTKDEAWDQKAQNRIFAFYAAVFGTLCIAWPFTVWNMNQLHPKENNKASNYWVASFFVGLGLEFLVADVICALLSKPSKLLRNIVRRKGYMYDNLCHETYMNYLKME